LRIAAVRLDAAAGLQRIVAVRPPGCDIGDLGEAVADCCFSPGRLRWGCGRCGLPDDAAAGCGGLPPFAWMRQIVAVLQDATAGNSAGLWRIAAVRLDAAARLRKRCITQLCAVFGCDGLRGYISAGCGGFG
jgi:hypothetical protein